MWHGCSGGRTKRHSGGAADYDAQIQNVQRAQTLQHVRVCLCLLTCNFSCSKFVFVNAFWWPAFFVHHSYRQVAWVLCCSNIFCSLAVILYKMMCLFYLFAFTAVFCLVHFFSQLEQMCQLSGNILWGHPPTFVLHCWVLNLCWFYCGESLCQFWCFYDFFLRLGA